MTVIEEWILGESESSILYGRRIQDRPFWIWGSHHETRRPSWGAENLEGSILRLFPCIKKQRNVFPEKELLNSRRAWWGLSRFPKLPWKIWVGERSKNTLWKISQFFTGIKYASACSGHTEMKVDSKCQFHYQIGSVDDNPLFIYACPFHPKRHGKSLIHKNSRCKWGMEKKRTVSILLAKFNAYCPCV
jgi:hypothetical protein